MQSHMIQPRVLTRAHITTSTRFGASDQKYGKLSEHLGGYTFRDGPGSGAYGSVFLAEVLSTSTRKFVAVKIVRRSRLVRQTTRDLLATEVRCLQQLTATGSMFFTQLHEAFCDGHNFYIVTDYLRGGTLRDEAIMWGSKMKADRVLFIMAQLVEALTQLRNARIIHRDLKPENILVDAIGNITVADFGMARRFEAQEQLAEPVVIRGHSTAATGPLLTRSTCGTVGYIAPEMYRGEYYSFEVDVYSLGVIFYELLFGKRPFPQRDTRELARAVCNGEWYVPTEYDVDPTAKRLLRRLLDVNPDKRIDLDGLRAHPFFRSVDWSAIATRSYELPRHHAPILRPINKVFEIRKKRFLDPNAVVPRDLDASAHPVVGSVDAVFTVKPSRKLVERPENPRSWSSLVSKVVSHVAIGILDAVLSACLDRATGQEGGSRRKVWPSVGKPFVTTRRADVRAGAVAPLNVREVQAVEKVEVEGHRARKMFSAFDCSIEAVEEYARPIAQKPAPPALRRVTARIPARPRIDMRARPSPETQPDPLPSYERSDHQPAVRPDTRRAATYPAATSVGNPKRTQPNLPRISTALPVRQPSPSSLASYSACDVSFVFTRALEEASLGLTPRARDVVRTVPSLAVSRSTMAPTTGPVTPARAYSCGPNGMASSRGKLADGVCGLDLDDVNARVQV